MAGLLLVDGGLEGALTFDGPPFVGTWEGFSGSAGATSAFSGTNVRTGAQSLELIIAGDAGSFTGAFQDVAIPASAIGSMSWFSGYHLNVGDAGGSEFRIEWRDAGGVEFAREQSTVSATGSVFEEFIIPATIPAGADTARIVYAIQSFGAALNQTVFVDDLNFNIAPVPEPTTALLALLGVAPLARRRR